MFISGVVFIMSKRTFRRYGDVKTQMKHAAMRLATEYGLTHWTIAQLAKEVNIPIGNLHYYLKFKSELVDYVADEILGQYAHQMTSYDLKRHRLYIEAQIYKTNLERKQECLLQVD